MSPNYNLIDWIEKEYMLVKQWHVVFIFVCCYDELVFLYSTVRQLSQLSPGCCCLLSETQQHGCFTTFNSYTLLRAIKRCDWSMSGILPSHWLVLGGLIKTKGVSEWPGQTPETHCRQRVNNYVILSNKDRIPRLRERKQVLKTLNIFFWPLT